MEPMDLLYGVASRSQQADEFRYCREIHCQVVQRDSVWVASACECNYDNKD